MKSAIGILFIFLLFSTAFYLFNRTKKNEVVQNEITESSPNRNGDLSLNHIPPSNPKPILKAESTKDPNENISTDQEMSLKKQPFEIWPADYQPPAVIDKSVFNQIEDIKRSKSLFEQLDREVLNDIKSKLENLKLKRDAKGRIKYQSEDGMERISVFYENSDSNGINFLTYADKTSSKVIVVSKNYLDNENKDIFADHIIDFGRLTAKQHRSVGDLENASLVIKSNELKKILINGEKHWYLYDLDQDRVQVFYQTANDPKNLKYQSYDDKGQIIK